MKCPKCNSNLPDDSLFCQYCGVNIEAARIEQAKIEADRNEKIKVDELKRLEKEQRETEEKLKRIELERKRTADELEQMKNVRDTLSNSQDPKSSHKPDNKIKFIIGAIVFAVVICILVIGNVNRIKNCNHKYVSEITKPSDCVNSGSVTYTCSTCGKQYTEELPLEDHSFDINTIENASCNNTGLEEVTCLVCGYKYTEIVPMTTHEFESRTTKVATCTAGGTVKYTCKYCGYSYTSSVKSKAHTPKDMKSVSPTCEKTGSTGGSVCSVCGTVLSTPVTLPAMGHNIINDICTYCGKHF